MLSERPWRKGLQGDFMVRTITFLTLLSFSLVGTLKAKTSEDWVGEYLYQGSAGKTYGGSDVGEEIFLTIEKSGFCRLTEQGYMLDKKILCQIKQSGTKVSIVYLTQVVQDEHPQGENGPISLYRRGDILFLLERSNPEAELVTHWKKLQAYGVKEKIGSYFEKVFDLKGEID